MSRIDGLVSQLPEPTARMLPDRFVAHQEVRAYRGRHRVLGIEFRGVSPMTRLDVTNWKQPMDTAILPSTDIPLTGRPVLFLQPLKKQNPKQVWLPRLLLVGDPRGVSLLDMGGDSRLADFNVAQTQGRYALQDLYFRRHFRNGNTASKFVRYFEAIPAKRWALAEETAIGNADFDLQEQLRFASGFQRPTKEYVKVGDVIIQGREKGVMVLGNDAGQQRQRILRIRDELGVLGYQPILAREEPEPAFASLEEKVKALLHLARFAVMEDSAPGGQIAEFDYCKNDRHILIVLRRHGEHSTWMIDDAHLVDIPFIRRFQYDESNLDVTLKEATYWAESFLQRRSAAYQEHFPWRVPPRT